MATATTVERYLGSQHLPFEVIAHPRATTSLLSARAAAIPATQIVKGVLLEAEGQYVLAILPAARHLRLTELMRHLDRDIVMASEHEVTMLFRECDPGAVPALGPAYGVETVWDDSVRDLADLYFEAGDHEHLVHMRTRDYLDVLRHCAHGSFSEPV
jgi:Ala-tRNA(Pro) deacylase